MRFLLSLMTFQRSVFYPSDAYLCMGCWMRECSYYMAVYPSTIFFINHIFFGIFTIASLLICFSEPFMWINLQSQNYPLINVSKHIPANTTFNSFFPRILLIPFSFLCKGLRKQMILVLFPEGQQIQTLLGLQDCTQNPSQWECFSSAVQILSQKVFLAHSKNTLL